ncbi:phage major capsid protein [Leucobacter sp. CSA1]|uniref:Phage major capsid protein n=1 Tax=Leucobacter chromiisoli TaxID=2796471 RepID=A0A934Q7V8_9MICO|nr:phage major capsid protein [Leucobacter chromiisoli]MBK0418284.1 phage major capsid protein [Leucobacter chromiisoli]
MAGIDLNRTTTGAADLLPKEISTEIWAETQEQSAVMQLARQINMPGSGVTIPIITGDAEADWVAETDEKPVSRASIGSKQITPYKLAVIEPFSNEFRRDLPAVYEELRRRLPNAIAKKFDQTVFGTTAPGSNFDTLGGAAAVAIGPHATDAKKSTYAGLVEAYNKVAEADGALDGWALSPQAKGLLLNQVDSTGRPLLFSSIQDGTSITQILGESVYYTKGVFKAGNPATIGFAGDWNSAMWGSVEGIKVSVSNEATITDGTVTVGSGENAVEIPNQLNLWQRNMFAILVEIEVGFRVRDEDRFVRLTNGARS